MGVVYDLESYRLFSNVRKMLVRDGIRCRIRFTDADYTALVKKFSSGKLQWQEFYMEVATLAMTRDSITVG